MSSNGRHDPSSDEWICAHLGDDYTDRKGSVSPPIYQSSTHVFESVEAMAARRGVQRPFTGKRTYFYGRDGNPTVEILEDKLAALEKTDGCLCFGSGMAAITSTVMHCLKPGDHAVVTERSYGSHFFSGLLADFGVEHTAVKGTSVDEFDASTRENTRFYYLESPVGSDYSIQNLAEVAKLAQSRGIITAIDNTWATPIHQKPHTFGIDLVIHSMSKYIGGHSDIIGGAVTGRWEHITPLARVRSTYGGILHPQEGYLALRGLRTLPVRMRAHAQNGMSVARYLERDASIVKVNFPGLESHPQHELAKQQMLGFSSLMSISMNAPVEKAWAFVNALRLFKIGVSWGGNESMFIKPRTLKQDERLAGTRMFVGLDNIDELLEDLEHALRLLR